MINTNIKTVRTDDLKRVVESTHGGTATLVQSVRVHQPARSAADWDGVVHVFDLKHNSKAKRSYAWSSPIQGSGDPRFFAVLHAGRVTGPLEAVKAAAEAIHRWSGNAKKK